MELHKALRYIINNYRENILCEIRLVNILSDFNAFENIQGAKYIMRALIDEGITRKLLYLDKYDNSAKELAHRFIITTGFNSDIVNEIFNSLAYGLGWIKRMPQAKKSDPSISVQTTKQSPTNNNSDSDHLLFRNIPITGSPQNFAKKLLAMGYKKVSYSYDDWFSVTGPFAGVPGCIIFAHFNSVVNTVYRVNVHFPHHENRDRITADYYILKKLLANLYGIPVSRYEEDEFGWESTYTIKMELSNYIL